MHSTSEASLALDVEKYQLNANDSLSKYERTNAGVKLDVASDGNFLTFNKTFWGPTNSTR